MNKWRLRIYFCYQFQNITAFVEVTATFGFFHIFVTQNPSLRYSQLIFSHKIQAIPNERPLQFLFATGREGQAISLSTESLYQNGDDQLILALNSTVNFIYTRYSILLVLDVSSSLAIVEGDSVVFSRLYHSLEQCLTQLVVPMKFGKTAIQPQICLSVIAVGDTLAVFQSLIQGFLYHHLSFLIFLRCLDKLSQLPRDCISDCRSTTKTRTKAC